MAFLDMGSGKKNQHSLIGTVIGEGTSVKGEISTNSSLRLDGSIEGSVFAQDEVFVGEAARVKGDVKGKRIIVAGQVNGNVISEESVEIRKEGKVSGDIFGNMLTVDEGASYKGRVTMGSAISEPVPVENTISDNIKEIIGL